MDGLQTAVHLEFWWYNIIITHTASLGFLMAHFSKVHFLVKKSSILRFFNGTFLHGSLFVGKLQTFQVFIALHSKPELLVIEGGFQTNKCLTYEVFGAGSFIVSFFGDRLWAVHSSTQSRPLDDHPSNDIRSQGRRYWQGLLRETIDLNLLTFPKF